ncbi:MAG: SGNH/GDSL hydrolase family protein [Sphaerochaetaceae bacterium]|nr:SGNH/GDSL hydrolase family protein [Sphaerochaetaceae bacterium]
MTLRVIGDSILKGIQPNMESGRYETVNNIDFEGATGMTVENFSKFGCTVSKGFDFAKRLFEKSPKCTYVLMDFGGNDSDYDWASIASDPYSEKGTYNPKTEPGLFLSTYSSLVDYVKSFGCEPILMTLPPIVPKRYLKWTCEKQDLEYENILTWLDQDLGRVSRTQKAYSDIASALAAFKNIKCIDINGAFNMTGTSESYMSVDGIHPNDAGQKLIHTCIRQTFSTISA